MRLGPWEIALIVMVVILLFGAKKIPEVMRGFGTGIKEFKKGLKEADDVPPTTEQTTEQKKSEDPPANH